MTLSEFKAWFSGYTEAIEEKPTQKQWDRIKARVDEIDNMPTTQTIYIEKYWPFGYRGPYVGSPYVYCSNSTITANAAGTPLSMASMTSERNAAETPTVNLGGQHSVVDPGHAHGAQWDSGVAMAALGKADAQADAV